AAGVPTAAPVIEPQCPAVSTHVGAISVPVHRKDWPNVISATAGYAPGAASLPPTTAIEGAAVRARAAQTAATPTVSRRSSFISSRTRAGAETCGRSADATRGDPPHHGDHRGRAPQPRLLHARHGVADDRQDGQSRRPDRLSPVLCRRARPSRFGADVLRVSG